MFIWTMRGSSGVSRAVETMCKKPRIDNLYVAIFAGYAGNVHSDTIGNLETRSAIDICRQYGVPVILFRLLFDPSVAEIARLEDMGHYIERIGLLKDEIARLGIEYCGFETEAYGEPLSGYMRGERFTENDYLQTLDHARTAVKEVGRVWAITPAGTYRGAPWHPYMAMAAELGYHQIGQGTYYDDPKAISEIAYPYDIAGMSVSARKSKPNSSRVFFTPRDVLVDRTEVWKDRAGVMAWVEDDDMELATAFAQAVR